MLANHIAPEILEELKQKLEDEEQELISILERRGHEDSDIPENYIATAKDEGDSIDQEVDRVESLDENNDIVQEMEIRLQKVKSALKRMEEGAYGLCVKTGMPISAERLKADPSAEESIDSLTTP